MSEPVAPNAPAPNPADVARRVAEQAGLSDDQLPLLPDPMLAFWKDTAKKLTGESIKSIEGAAKQIITLTSFLEGLYFHAITYTDLKGKLNHQSLAIYIAPLVCWMVSLALALLVFFPLSYSTNLNSSRESRVTFESIVGYKHRMLKAAGIFLTLGALALTVALGKYLAG